MSMSPAWFDQSLSGLTHMPRGLIFLLDRIETWNARCSLKGNTQGLLLHCFVPSFGHFPATTPRHHPPPPIPPWYLGASHEYQHGRACPTTEPHPTSLATHTHTNHACTHTHEHTPLSPASPRSRSLPALLAHVWALSLGGAHAQPCAAINTHSCTFTQTASS